MFVPDIRVTLKKDGREVPWFRDEKGRVRTGDVSGTWGVYGINWTRAAQVKEMIELGLRLHREQALAGLGSDGAPMPPLKSPKRKVRFSIKKRRVVEYGSWETGYPALKKRMGLQPKRDLWGPGGLVVSYTGDRKHYLRSGSKASRVQSGGRGHMLDDMRVNYVDDKRATYTISNQASRTKARANEQRARWWGWGPQALAKMRTKWDELAGTGVTERLFQMGLIGTSALAFVKARTLRRAA